MEEADDRIDSCREKPLRADPQIETFIVDCVDVGEVVPRLTLLFARRGIELQNLSTWRSLTPSGAPGLVVSLRRPRSMTEDAIPKSMNRLIGVTRVRRKPYDEARRFEGTGIEISATGYYTDKLAVLGCEFNATPIHFSRKMVVVQLFDSAAVVDKFVSRLMRWVDPRKPGDVRISAAHGSGLMLPGRRASKPNGLTERGLESRSDCELIESSTA